MHIGMILPVLVTKNGTAKQCLELSIELRRLGHHVTIFTYAYAPHSTFEGVAHLQVKRIVTIEKTLTFNPFFLEKLFLFAALVDGLRFRALIRKTTTDVLHANDWLTMWIASGVDSERRLVVSINDVPERDRRTIDCIKLMIDRVAAKHVYRFFVLDNRNQRRVVNWLRIPTTRVSVVRSGVDKRIYTHFTERVDYLQEYRLNKNSIIIVCANILGRHRRYENVIRALKDFRRVHLFILSKTDADPNYAKELLALGSALGISERVHVVDKYFSDRQRMSYIAGANALVFPNYPQTWGLTVLEAIALGVPVVVSDQAGVADVLMNNKNAYIYPATDVNALVRCIRRLVAGRYTPMMIKEARRMVLTTYTWAQYAKRVILEYP